MNNAVFHTLLLTNCIWDITVSIVHGTGTRVTPVSIPSGTRVFKYPKVWALVRTSMHLTLHWWRECLPKIVDYSVLRLSFVTLLSVYVVSICGAYTSRNVAIEINDSWKMHMTYGESFNLSTSQNFQSRCNCAIELRGGLDQWWAISCDVSIRCLFYFDIFYFDMTSTRCRDIDIDVKVSK